MIFSYTVFKREFRTVKIVCVQCSYKFECSKVSITLCPFRNFPALLFSAEFFQNYPFRNIFSVIQSKCQTVWIQIRPDVLSGLIWVQTVGKSY